MCLSIRLSLQYRLRTFVNYKTNTVYRATILNVISGVILVMAVGLLALTYQNLEYENHGFLGAFIIVLAVVGLLGFLLDFILQKAVKEYTTVNIIEAA